ncbi:hypothetical protein [Sphingomonas sp.]|uniref:hypothetical protein n=1 Tax=Sphingomonas sp. TaxID=28214 RepID=UPI002EDA98CF
MDIQSAIEGAKACITTVQAAIDLLDLKPVPVQRFGTIAALTDCIDVVDEALAWIEERGGGVILEFPYIGGYEISREIIVTTPNTFLRFMDPVLNLTSTTACAAVSFRGTIDNLLLNVGIIGPVEINGNGSNVVGYVYDTGNPISGDNPCLLFKWVDGALAERVIARNGLTCGLRSFQCRDVRWIDCEGHDSVYDNGGSIEYNHPTFDPDIPSTWSSSQVVRFKASGNRGFGIGSFGAKDVFFQHPKVWDNGNNDGTHPAGAGGGIALEFHLGGAFDFDHRLVVLEPDITNVWGAGIYVTCGGTRVQGGRIDGVKEPTEYPDGAEQGDGIVLFGQTSIDTNCTITNCDRHGIFALATEETGLPSITYRGVMVGCGGSAISARGASYVRVLPETIIESCGGVVISVTNDNADYNAGNGSVFLSGNFNNNENRVSAVDGVARCIVGKVQGSGNGTGLSTASIAMDHQNVALVDVDGVILTENDSNVYFGVRATSTCDEARIKNVSGTFTAAAISNAASTVIATTLTAPTGGNFVDVEARASLGAIRNLLIAMGEAK